MKKITIIASLLVVFTACQKADIRPRTGCTESTPEMKSISRDNNNTNPDGGTINSLGGGPGSSNPTIDPNSPTGGEPNEGEITDPLRKKDQKDNR